MRISDWSSDVSSDLATTKPSHAARLSSASSRNILKRDEASSPDRQLSSRPERRSARDALAGASFASNPTIGPAGTPPRRVVAARDRQSWMSASARRSEEHTSELQSLMRISYAVFCMRKKTVLILITYQKYSESV